VKKYWTRSRLHDLDNRATQVGHWALHAFPLHMSIFISVGIENFLHKKSGTNRTWKSDWVEGFNRC